MGRLEWKKCSGAQKSAKIRFLLQKVENAFFAFWTGKHLPEPYVYKAFYALAKTVIFFAFSGFFTFYWKYFSLLPRKFYEQRKFFAQKNRFPKTFIWALFLRVHTIFPRQKRIWSTFCEKFATFRKFAFWGEKVRFFRKNQLFRCQEFHFRPDRSKPYETCPFLGVLGSIFLHFALFHSISLFSRQNRSWHAKSLFLRKSTHFCGLG